MIEPHFGLSGPAFQSVNPGPLFLSATHREALATLEWGLREPSGFTLLTGDTGTGKTTLIYALLGRHTMGARIVHLANPRLSFNEMLRLIVERLGVRPRHANRLYLMDALSAQLHALKEGERLVVLVDEAQSLSDEGLENLRLLANLPAAAMRPLQLILVGQPSLLRRLGAEKMRQLNERIGARAQLRRLGLGEVRAYIEHRLALVGGRAEVVFSRGALKALGVYAQGLPRRINVLCHNSMLLAYAAGRRRVESAMVESAAREYDNWLERYRSADGAPAGAPRARRALSGIGLATLAGVMAAWLGWNLQTRWHGIDLAHQIARLMVVGRRLEDLTALPHRAASSPAPLLTGVVASNAHAAAGAVADFIQGAAPPAANAAPSVARAHSAAAGAVRRGGSSATGPTAHRVVIVRPGDTVARLTLRYVGSVSPDTLQLVARANPQIANLDLVYPGEMVVLPRAEEQPQ